MYAFVMHPKDRPGQACMFLHETISEIAGFEPELLEEMAIGRYGDEFDLESMVFHEIGEYRPLSFKKVIYFTLNQED